ncbi:hypothetical protein SKAU_G00386740 [Synaphobranchus kaupii]|uniref:Uncharacterized protein n=1 Tax=Synaphobranchus kaupii TaxID=118154 RepID=A0A9Q1EAT6_SYNKA|nr:hypothetical protein SKAU_G00386740 [Synaphobranchus kaupii]
MKRPLRRGENEKEKEDEPGSARRKLSFGSGSGKGSTVRFIQLPDSIEDYLDEYREFQEGVEPTDKQQENVQSKVSRIEAFLEFMSVGQTDLWTWSFLCQPQRILDTPDCGVTHGKAGPADHEPEEDIKTASLTNLAVRTRFNGYLAAFLQSLYGHRSGVLTNMTVPEVLQAEGDETVGYVINVSTSVSTKVL